MAFKSFLNRLQLLIIDPPKLRGGKISRNKWKAYQALLIVNSVEGVVIKIVFIGTSWKLIIVWGMPGQ